MVYELTIKVMESQVIEWKETWRDEYLKWICGFANAQGGTLIIGKNDDGKAVGVSDAQRLLEDIPNKIKDILGIIVDVNLKTENGKEYIEINVEAYPFPVSYRGQYHIRSGSTKQELSGNALNSFLLRKFGLHWDAVPVPNFSVDMLEKDAFKLFTEKAIKSKRLGEEILNDSHDTILRKLLLFEGSYLKRATALLFLEEPENFITGAYIKIGFFRTDSDLVYQDEIHGNLFLQVDKTMDLLLTKYMKAYISYEGLQRIEQFLFPAPALREALLNAVIHKDYASCNPIQISVYHNKIIFWNAGKLPEEITLQTLQAKHPSIPYNPLVAAAFFRTGYIEAWGRGIERIIEECKTVNAPVPVFDPSFGGLMVTFDAGNIDYLEEAPKNEFGKNQEKTMEKSTQKNTRKTKEKIIELMKYNPKITSEEMTYIIGLKWRAIQNHIAILKKNGNIERVGSDKNGEWHVLKDY